MIKSLTTINISVISDRQLMVVTPLLIIFQLYPAISWRSVYGGYPTFNHISAISVNGGYPTFNNIPVIS